MVVDVEEKPIENAAVSLVQGGRRWEMRTGADGEFGWDDLPAGHYRLEIAAAGFSQASQRVEVAPGEHAPLGSIVLMPGVGWSGLVVDSLTDEPVTGARVTSRRPTGAVAAVTDEAGFFEASSSPEGDLVVAVEATGYPQQTVTLSASQRQEREPAVIRLQAGGFIRVLTFDEDSGEACVGCAVSVAGDDRSVELRADANGVAMSAALAPGLYRVTKEKLRSLGSVAERRSGDSAKSVQVRAGVTSEVRLGDPQQWLEVVVRPAAPDGWSVRAATSGGRLQGSRLSPEVHRVPRGHGAITLTLSNGADRHVRLGELEASDDRPRIEFELPAGGVEGRLIAEDGPLPAERIDVVSATTGRSAGVTFTDSWGRFALGYLPVDSYHLLAEGRVLSSITVGSRVEELGDVTLQLRVGNGTTVP